MSQGELVYNLEVEIELLRKALEPFALMALTRSGQDASVPDDTPVTVTMGQCRFAQKAMGA